MKPIWNTAVSSSTLFALLASLAATAPAQAAAPAKAPAPLENPEPGWHVIRPGDTLESLAQKYLGDARHWTEIHRLNPGIDDPHWIYPGRRIRVVLERPSSTPNAQVTALARRVESRPEPVTWRPADQGDLLLEKDGLRTFENSSARLLFDDGTSATVSQESLVFIRRQSPARSKTPKKEIEIVLGQADLEAKRRPSLATPEIEIVVAGVKSTSHAGADGTVRSRGRKSGDAAQFMLYEGSGKVSAKGGAVDLAAGTGTVVAPKSAPTAPEALLLAPALGEPADAGELGRDEPLLQWAPVAGARSYLVELCADVDCGSVRERRAGLEATEWRLAEPLAAGDSFWRVTAVAPSGLDGFPSAARRFTAVDAARPPAPTITLLDRAGVPLGGGTLLLVAAPLVQVRALDAKGTELSWRLQVDGADSTPDDLALLGVSGRHEIAAVAVDARGREARSVPVVFELDAASPLIELPASPGGTPLEEPKSTRASRRRAAEAPPAQPCAAGIELWDGAAWAPIACGTMPATEIALSGLEGELRLRTTRALVVGEKRLVAAGVEAAARVSDVGSGLALARVAVVASPHRKAAGRSLLEVEIVDRAGRSTRASWHVELR